jgi:hypothetical protein
MNSDEGAVLRRLIEARTVRLGGEAMDACWVPSLSSDVFLQGYSVRKNEVLG